MLGEPDIKNIEDRPRSWIKVLLFIHIFSLFNDLMVIPLGFTMPFHYVITLLLLPKIFSILRELDYARYLMRPLWLEWRYLLVLTFVFGFLMPWEYMDHLRSFTQVAATRSIISIFRLFLELCSVIVPLVFLIRYKVSFRVIFDIIAYTTLLTFTIAVIDFVLGFPLKSSIGARFIEGRITGLSGEPRAFGKMMLMGFVIISFAKAKIETKLLYNLTLFISLLGIVISSSASALFSFIAVVLPISVLFWKKELLIIPAILIMSVYIYGDNLLNSLVSSEIITYRTLSKIEAVLGEERVSDDVTTVRGGFVEPEFFKRFEIFDRAALNFLYDNPKYALVGTGPNLISIPSSEYVNDYDRVIYGEVINSVPHTFFINVISRSGIVGLVLVIMLFFVRFNKLLSQEAMLRNKQFFWQVFAVNLLVFSSLFFFSLGLIFISIYVKKQAVNHNPNS